MRAYRDLLDALGRRERGAATVHARWRFRSSCRPSGRRCRATARRSRSRTPTSSARRPRDVGVVGDRRRRGPHHHRLDAVDRARSAARLPLARHGSAGLPASAPRTTAGVRRRGCADPAVQGRVRRARLGGLPRRRRGHRVLPALPARADGRRRLPDGRLSRSGDHRRRARHGAPNTAGASTASSTRCCTASATPSSAGSPTTGNHVRVYVPFGTQWYGYFVRRLAERPANLTFFLRALAERRH